MLAALYFIPWPTRVDATFNAKLVYSGGNELEIGKVSVSGWKYNYLFKDTMLDIDIDLPAYYDWYQPQNHSDSYLFNELWPAFENTPYWVSQNVLLQRNTNEMSSVFCAISEEDGKFILWNEESPETPYLIGSVETDYNAANIMEYFSVFVEICEGFAS